jgi:hypothetical protein
VRYFPLEGQKMAKIQVILLNAIIALFVAIIILVQTKESYITDAFAAVILLLLFFLLSALVVISIINIFYSLRLVKQRDEEKLEKSAVMVKLGLIPLWIIIPFLYIYFTFWYYHEAIIILLSLSIPQAGTSIFSIAYIQLLHKNKKLNTLPTIILTILQFIFVLDIISTLVLRDKQNIESKKSIMDIVKPVRSFLSSLKPAAFAETLASAFKQGPAPRIAKEIGAFFAEQLQKHLLRSCLIAAALCLLPAAPIAYNFYQSSKPQPINVSFRVQAPGSTGNPDTRRPLSVFFRSPAAPPKMKGREVPAGKIAIAPPIEGVWQWRGENVLAFSTGQEWLAGERYTVTFVKNIFPSHIIVNNSFHFDIERFSLRILEREFNIDGGDGSIKRVLFTVQANYPIDAASLEENITIEPQISADSGSLKKQPCGFSVSYNDDRTHAYIVSEPLGMPERAVRMRLDIATGVRNSSREGNAARRETASVEIPGLFGSVRVRGINHGLVRNERQIYEQVLTVITQGTADAAGLSNNIEAWVLPRNYEWGNMNEITPAVLASSRRVSLEAVPAEARYSSANSWKFRAEPGQYIYARVNKGAQFYGGYILDEPFETVFRVQFPPQEITRP